MRRKAFAIATSCGTSQCSRKRMRMRALRIFRSAILNRWLSDALVSYFSIYIRHYAVERRTADVLRLTLAMVGRWPSLMSRPEVRALLWQAVGPAKSLRSATSAQRQAVREA